MGETSSDEGDKDTCSTEPQSSSTDTSFHSEPPCSYTTNSSTESSVSSLEELREIDLLEGNAEFLVMDADKKQPAPSYASLQYLRITYLLVTLVIMLADGLQGKILTCYLLLLLNAWTDVELTPCAQERTFTCCTKVTVFPWPVFTALASQPVGCYLLSLVL